jgi:hypothetical protein
MACDRPDQAKCVGGGPIPAPEEDSLFNKGK